MKTYEYNLKVSPHQLYEFLLEQIALEASSKAGRKITLASVKEGTKYSYNRSAGKKKSIKAVVHIRKPQPDTFIQTDYDMGDTASFKMIYKITPGKNKQTCHVAYSQDNGRPGNNFVNDIFMRVQLNKRMRKIEQYLLSLNQQAADKEEINETDDRDDSDNSAA